MLRHRQISLFSRICHVVTHRRITPATYFAAVQPATVLAKFIDQASRLVDKGG
jgi:hypothetical protein